MKDRLLQQIDFIVEIDKLKHIYRQTILMDESRNENDAEHSWHLAIMAILLAEHAEMENLNVFKVVKMVLLHDLVEIDAGDTFCYDEKGYEDKKERETRAAERIFNILPRDQAQEFRDMWDEFEEQLSPEAKFAASLDRLQPLLHNYLTKGKSWHKNKVTSDKVLQRNNHIKEGSELLWRYAEEIINDSVKKGYLPR